MATAWHYRAPVNTAALLRTAMKPAIRQQALARPVPAPGSEGAAPAPTPAAPAPASRLASLTAAVERSLSRYDRAAAASSSSKSGSSSSSGGSGGFLGRPEFERRLAGKGFPRRLVDEAWKLYKQVRPPARGRGWWGGEEGGAGQPGRWPRWPRWPCSSSSSSP
jgi:hypothetical protein